MKDYALTIHQTLRALGLWEEYEAQNTQSDNETMRRMQISFNLGMALIVSNINVTSEDIINIKREFKLFWATAELLETLDESSPDLNLQ